MQLIFSLLVLIALLTATKSQTWIGNYAVQPGCNNTLCCCFHGPVAVTNTSQTHLHMTSGIEGQCSNRTSPSGSVAHNSSHIFSAKLNDWQLQFILNNVSSTIVGSYSNLPTCVSTAVKTKVLDNGAVTEHLSVGLPFIALLFLQTFVNIIKI